MKNTNAGRSHAAVCHLPRCFESFGIKLIGAFAWLTERRGFLWIRKGLSIRKIFENTKTTNEKKIIEKKTQIIRTINKKLIKALLSFKWLEFMNESRIYWLSFV